MAQARTSLVKGIKTAISNFTFVHRKALLALSFVAMVAGYSLIMPLVPIFVASGFTALAYYVGFERKRRMFWEQSISFKLMSIDKKVKAIQDKSQTVVQHVKPPTPAKAAEPKAPQASKKRARRYDQIAIDDGVVLDKSNLRASAVRKAKVSYQEPVAHFAMNRPLTKKTLPNKPNDIFYSDSLLQEFIQNAIQKNSFSFSHMPIVRVSDKSSRFIDVSAHIEGYTGRYLAPSQYGNVAHNSGLSGKIMLATLSYIIDTLRTTSKNDRFYTMSIPHTMLFDGGFMNTVLQLARSDRAEVQRIIFALTYTDFETMPPRGLQIMRSLKQLGCQFMVREVNTLSPDVELMQSCGVQSIMLPADYFMRVMNDPARFRETLKARRHLEGSGLRVIVSGIHDTAMLETLAPLALRYAHGTVFDNKAGGTKRSPLTRVA